MTCPDPQLLLSHIATQSDRLIDLSPAAAGAVVAVVVLLQLPHLVRPASVGDEEKVPRRRLSSNRRTSFCCCCLSLWQLMMRKEEQRMKGNHNEEHGRDWSPSNR
jgi:hypothetical protein